MREAYREQLDGITTGLVEMSRLAGTAMGRASTALLDADLTVAPEDLPRFVEVLAEGLAPFVDARMVAAYPDDDWILIHDAARPCVPEEALARLVAEVSDDAVGQRTPEMRADAVDRREALGQPEHGDPTPLDHDAASLVQRDVLGSPDQHRGAHAVPPT